MDHAFRLTKKYGRIALAWASAPLDLTALKNAHEQRRAFPISIRLVVAAHPAAIVRVVPVHILHTGSQSLTSEGTAHHPVAPKWKQSDHALAARTS